MTPAMDCRRTSLDFSTSAMFADGLARASKTAKTTKTKTL